MKQPRKFKEMLPVKFTPEEKASLADRSDELIEELQRLELLKAALPKKIESAKDQIYETSEQRKSGFRDKLVDCEEREDAAIPEMYTVRLDTGEEISRRAMTERERQEDLFPPVTDAQTDAMAARAVHAMQEESVAAFFDKTGQPTISKELAEAILEIVDDVEIEEGTPTKTERSVTEIDLWARSIVTEGKPVKRIYVDGNPYVAVSHNGTVDKMVDSVQAFSVLPVSIAGDDPDKRKFNCGTKKKPEFWIIVGELTTFTIGQTEPRVEEQQGAVGDGKLFQIEPAPGREYAEIIGS